MKLLLSARTLGRLALLGAISLFMPLVYATGAAADAAVTSYRMAKYSFQVAPENNSNPVTVELAYPVFLGGDSASTSRLNGWLRRTALKPFFMDDEEGLSRALQLTDRKLIESLASKGRENMTQSVLRPDAASGNIMTFTLNVESLGIARSHQGIAVYAYDIRSQGGVTVQSLFRPSAEEVLAEYFLEEIQKEAPGCQAIDFSWDHVTLRGPSEASLYFSFNPAQQECGDLGYLKGKKVRDLLKLPSLLLPIRKLKEVI
jgi:hypothetical protein